MDTVTGTSTSTGMTQRHEQFLKNHNMTQPVRHGSSTLNEVSLLPRTAQVNSLSMMKPNSNVLYIYIYIYISTGKTDQIGWLMETMTHDLTLHLALTRE